MYRITSFLVLVLSVIFAGAQNNISTAMEQYIVGCDKLLTGFDSKNLADVAKAKLLLSKPRLTSYQDFELANATDSCVILQPTILFTPDYAREIIKSGIINDPREQTNPYIMRRPYDDFDLQIWNASIAPNASATFKGEAVDDCEMLLLSEDHAGLTLTIKSDYSSPIETEKHLTEHCEYTTSVWRMKEQGDFFFTISNTSDKKQTFVIAIN